MGIAFGEIRVESEWVRQGIDGPIEVVNWGVLAGAAERDKGAMDTSTLVA